MHPRRRDVAKECAKECRKECTKDQLSDALLVLVLRAVQAFAIALLYAALRRRDAVQIRRLWLTARCARRASGELALRG